MAPKKTIRLQVHRNPSGIVTVVASNDEEELYTRLCGVKLHRSGSTKVAEFTLDRAALDACIDLLGDDDGK